MPSQSIARELLRRVSARVYNPLAMLIAGRPHSPYAILVTVGRKTGRIYRVPVVAHRISDGFIVPLPYGPDVNWLRNVLAAGGGRVVWQGGEYHLVEPQIVDPQSVRSELPPRLWKTLTVTGTHHFLRLRLPLKPAIERESGTRSNSPRERARGAE